jgi:dihydroorotate dehydrogenase
MAHDRVTLAGTMISIGVLYAQLAVHSVCARVHWARQAIAVSATVGFLSFFLFLGFGYFDPLHALAALLLLPLFLLGLRERADAPPIISAPDRSNDWAWRWAQWGQLGFVSLGIGLIGAGLAIALVGVTRVFVPEDLAFLRTTPTLLQATNPRLVALIAHDRAGFGGALVSDGLAVLLLTLWGIRRGARWVWWTLLAAGLVGFAGAIGVHLSVGYLDLWHISPALLAVLVYGASLALLYRYLN